MKSAPRSLNSFAAFASDIVQFMWQRREPALAVA